MQNDQGDFHLQANLATRVMKQHAKSLFGTLLALVIFSLFAPQVFGEDLSAYAPRDRLGTKWDEMGWINDTSFPWVYSYTYSNWYYVYDGVHADTSDKGYWIFYLTPDGNASGWGYIQPKAGWWYYTLDNTVYWLKFRQSLPAGGHVLRVALMFDDGPSANTERLLKILADKGVKANFDLIGTNCEANPALVKAIKEGGHSILNHGYRHAQPATLSTSELAGEIADCSAAIKNITGDSPMWYWPPYIAIDSRLNSLLAADGMEMCIHSTIVGASDYDRSVNAETIRIRSINYARNGSLIVFHEWRDESIDEMTRIIDGLRDKGCVFLPYADMDAYLKSR